MALLLVLPALASAAEFAVIASPDVPLADLSMNDVRRIFIFKRTTWKPGSPVTVLLPAPGSPARATVLSSLCRLDESGLLQLVKLKVFQAELDAVPRTATSDAAAVATVAAGRGLVSVVSAGAGPFAGLRVLRVDGKLPGDAEYPISR